MCLALPAKLTESQLIGENRVGKVDLEGVARTVFLDLVPEAKIGDYLLVHADFAIEVLDERAARRTSDLLAQLI